MTEERGPRRIGDVPAADDAVAQMLRQAGTRPAVSEADTAVVKAAAFDEWERLVVSQNRRRWSWRLGAGLAAAALFLLAVNYGLLKPLTTPTLQIATVEVVHGQVTVLADREPQPAEPGVALAIGSEITTSANDRTVLRLADGTTLRLDYGTHLKFLAANRVELDSGAVYIDSGPNAPSKAIAVHTAHGVARDIGTRFEVRLENELSPLTVRVRDGEVALERGEATYPAKAGPDLQVASDGTVTEAQMLTHGEIWEWTLDILPRFEVEERSLHEVLIWAADQAELELLYTSPDLEELAAEIVLHGSIQGMSFNDALVLVFLSTDLDLVHRIEDGELRIEMKSEF